MKNITLISLFVTLVGCSGPQVNIRVVDENITRKVPTYKDKSILKEDSTTILGVVEATSCKHLLWDEESSLKNCTAQLKMRAFDLGANGLVSGGAEYNNADFTTSKGINRNCWNTVDCSGIAIIKDEVNEK